MQLCNKIIKLCIYLFSTDLQWDTGCNCTFLQCVNDIIFVESDLADCDNTQFRVDRVWSFWFFVWFKFWNFFQGFRCVFIFGQKFLKIFEKFLKTSWKILKNFWNFLTQKNYLKIMEFFHYGSELNKIEHSVRLNPDCLVIGSITFA